MKGTNENTEVSALLGAAKASGNGGLHTDLANGVRSSPRLTGKGILSSPGWCAYPECVATVLQCQMWCGTSDAERRVGCAGRGPSPHS
jgi:hypothetical protein